MASRGGLSDMHQRRLGWQAVNATTAGIGEPGSVEQQIPLFSTLAHTSDAVILLFS